HFVEAAVRDENLDVHHWVAREHAALNGLFDAVNGRVDVFFGNRPADDFAFDLDAFAALVGLDGDAGVAVLTATTGLADEFAFAFGELRDGLTISDLRRAGICLHFELAEQAIPDDFQMEFAHPGNDELPGLFVGKATKSGIF